MAASGFTPISLYFSTTAATVPSAANLVAGELALNTLDEKLYFKNSTGTVKLLAGATSGPAGGSTTEVQYNNAGVLAGITGATTNGTALTLVAPVLGTPASGIVTNLTGTASININGTVGATTPTSVSATTIVASNLLTQAAGANIASAATIDLSTATGNGPRITGTTAISAVTMTTGQQALVVADGALPLTYNATTNNLNSAAASVTLAAGDMVLYSKDLSGIVHGNIIKADGTSVVAASGGFASGTVMLFVQTAAPTGFTKSTTHNDKALRVVSGTVTPGGTTAFSTVFTNQTPTITTSGLSAGATTLTTAQMPSHTHTFSVNNVGGGGCFPEATRSANTSNTTAGTGGGGSHTHTVSGTATSSAVTLNVAYVDVIIATKD